MFVGATGSSKKLQIFLTVLYDSLLHFPIVVGYITGSFKKMICSFYIYTIKNGYSNQ